MRLFSSFSRAPLSAGSATALAIAAALGLSACASLDPSSGSKAASAPVAKEDRSSYGLFLAGEAALDNDADQAAAEYFLRADQVEQSDMVKQKAFLAAVAAGDVDKAAALAPQDDASPGLQRLGQLVRAVADLSAGRGKDAYAAMAKEPGGFAYVGGYALIKPWAALAAGDGAHAAQLPDTQGQRLNRLASVLSRSLIDERLRRYDEADSGYKVLTNNTQFGVFYVMPYGAFLERRGRGKDAQALYKRFLVKLPGDPGLQAAMARVAARRPAPPAPSLREGAGGALISAAELALVQKSVDEAELYLRLGLKLDPTAEEAWLILGELHAGAGRYEDARAEYAHIAPDSPVAMEAREKIIASYQNAGDHDTALSLAREFVKSAPTSRDAQLSLADALRQKMQYEESARILTAVIDANPSGADWTLYFLRGTSLSEAGHWPEAEQDLQKALVLQPDQPDILNYLGYSWVDKGQKLQQAMAMLQKAATAEPESGEIADSLGWAYYRLGDYRSAVLNLEKAVGFNAVSPEINDHLGDAYWQVGRKAEAQYQWRRVLALQPSPELKAAAQKKLASGLNKPLAPVAQG